MCVGFPVVLERVWSVLEVPEVQNHVLDIPDFVPGVQEIVSDTPEDVLNDSWGHQGLIELPEVLEQVSRVLDEAP